VQIDSCRLFLALDCLNLSFLGSLFFTRLGVCVVSFGGFNFLASPPLCPPLLASRPWHTLDSFWLLSNLCYLSVSRLCFVRQLDHFFFPSFKKHHKQLLSHENSVRCPLFSQLLFRLSKIPSSPSYIFLSFLFRTLFSPTMATPPPRCGPWLAFGFHNVCFCLRSGVFPLVFL